ncbi:uncharacterized protein Dvar_82660 [Desulfosarcina variabilis str. Montpellier]|uniref:hypothetical protein n=1 Tax=Desulfosarcina variabilis TaxID=2300 RepID=UPI003AFA58A3
MIKKLIAGIGLALALFAVYWGIQMYASNAAEAKVNEVIAKNASIVDVDYKKVSVDLLRTDVHLFDILVSPVNAKEKISIDEIIISDFDDQSDIPSFLSMTCNGIGLNINDLGKNAHKLRALGYNDKLMVNLTTNYTCDKEKRELNIQKLSLGADDIGKISVGFRLGNISLEPVEIAMLIFSFPQIIFHEARIEYQDDSLVDRLIKFGAEQKNVSAEDFKKALIGDIEKEIAKEKDEFAQNALIEVKKFLADPDDFTISACPSQPQPLGRIMRTHNPKDFIKLLNIHLQS